MRTEAAASAKAQAEKGLPLLRRRGCGPERRSRPALAAAEAKRQARLEREQRAHPGFAMRSPPVGKTCSARLVNRVAHAAADTARRLGGLLRGR
jgi:hypothetical protein